MKTRIIYIQFVLSLFMTTAGAQPVNSWVKDVVQPSPNAAALFKYTDVPVDYASGLPGISVPIHSFQHGPIPVNVSLSYHAQGMRVAENSSWVGLGWNLAAGGQIARSTMGEPDETTTGYYYGGYMVGPPSGCPSQNNCWWMHGLACGTQTLGWGSGGYPWVPTDLEPDLFSYSFGGYSGKFIIDKDHVVRLIDPTNDVKISYVFNNGFESFTILAPDGNRYIFGKYGTTTAYEETKAGASAAFWRSGWMLLRVESYDLKYYVIFNYTNETFSYKNPSSGQYVFSSHLPQGPIFPGSNGFDVSNHPYTFHYISGKRLSSIVTPLETITFEGLTNRLDLDTYGAYPAKRLDNINISTGGYCKKFSLSYDYSQDGTSTFSYHKRLMLLSVQEKTCDNVITNPPYVFTYSGNIVSGKLFLPNRLSKAVDHWGFYNGQTANSSTVVNVPATSVSLTGPPATNYSYGSANRESNQTNMLYGSLKRVTYPTGGYTEFEMEANVAWKATTTSTNTYLISGLTSCAGTPSQACCGYITVQQNVTFTSATQISQGKFNLSAVTPEAAGNGPCAGAYETYAKVQIYQGSTLKGTYSLNLASGQTSATANNKNLSEFNATLITGVAYTFKLQTANCKGAFDLYYPTTTSSFVNYTVGGLRVKKVTSHDAVSSANDIIRHYSYNDLNTPTLSSGALINKPEYVAAASYVRTVENPDCSYSYPIVRVARFKDYTQTPISNFEGRHILYKNVRETITGHGYTDYTFDAVGMTIASFGQVYSGHCTETIGTPFGMAYEPASGKMLSRIVKNNSGVTLLTEAYTYETGYSFVPGYAMKNESFECDYHFGSNCNGSGTPWGTMAYMAQVYQIRIGRHLLKTRSVTLDGVNTVTTNTFSPTYNHHQPTSSAITNSDGKVYTTYYKYIHDLTASTLSQKLLEYNLLLPAVETYTSTGSTQLSGSKFNYSFFTTSGNPTSSYAAGYYPYPYQYYNYEMTYNSSGTPQAGAWNLAATVNTMNMTYARPAALTVANWQTETYEWETYGRLKKRIFGAHQWQYAYHTGTRLLSTMTDIDGQVSSFTYDGLMRLSQLSARSGNVVTDYTYQYKDASNLYSYVNSRTTYTPVTGSLLSERESRQYLDGLGRVLQTVVKKHSPNQKDVVGALAYDNQGRQYRVYEPFETTNTNAAFTAPSAAIKYTLTEYETSPLSRVLKTTPPGGYATLYAYGANIANEIPTSPGGSTYYAANALVKNTTTDPMGFPSIQYLDKKGRLVATKKTDAGSNSVLTYNVYDDKDRLTKVVPPGSTNTSTTLNFVYTYDAKDNILTKKAPDQAVINFKYNNRSLSTYSQDGNLLAAGQWVNTQYDTYGRVTKTGIYTGTPANGDFVPASLTTVLTDNTYGAAGIELGKLKTGKVKILGTANDLSTTYTYDIYGRIASSSGNNHLNLTAGSETHAYTYDFADNVLTDTRVHKPSASLTYNLAERITYDHAGRQSDYFHKLNGVETQISNQKYDYKDQLIERNIGKVTSPLATWLQSVDYTYNDQGWLTLINGNTLTGTNLAFPTACTPGMPNPGTYTIATNPDPNDLFYMELRYDTPFSSTSGNISGMPSTNSQKSGNIAQIAWKVKGRDRQSYDFTYDYLDRLKTAVYYNVNSSNTATATNRFNETLNYDVRGNITSLTRTGFYENGAVCGFNTIDQLTYSYTSNTNKLATVTDAAPTTNNQRNFGFNPGAGGVGYTYDVNGNLKTDTYKGITSIVYNHLNLPTSILWGTAKKIDIQYDAAGGQLSRTVYTGATVDYKQDYVAGVEYRTVGATRKLESIAHAEGRRYNTNVNTASSTEALRIEYSIRDHLGNTRITFTDKNSNGKIDVTTTSTNEILSEQHYYPFGLTFGGKLWMNEVGDVDNRYQYNGKELTGDHGLGWYNYGARWYDPSIGRWNAVDPLADEMASWSPYNYTFNNPLRFIDPNGMAPFGDYYGSSGKYLGSDSNDDNKVHIIKDKQETKDVKKALRVAKKNDLDQSFVFDNADLSSTTTITTGIVNGVVKSTEDMGKDTSKGAGDAGLHEEGGHSESGSIVFWDPGPKKDGKVGKASIPLFNGVDTPDPTKLDAVWHVHTNKKTPTGNVVDGKEEYRVGASGPSSAGRTSDLAGHRRLEGMGFKGVSIVSGGSSNAVHFYNGSGSYFSTSFSRFKKMGQ